MRPHQSQWALTIADQGLYLWLNKHAGIIVVYWTIVVLVRNGPREECPSYVMYVASMLMCVIILPFLFLLQLNHTFQPQWSS